MTFRGSREKRFSELSVYNVVSCAIVVPYIYKASWEQLSLYPAKKKKNKKWDKNTQGTDDYKA